MAVRRWWQLSSRWVFFLGWLDVPSREAGPRRIIFAAGGTAGHVEPALATADMVRKNDANARIRFLATSAGIENQLVPPRGYELLTVPKAAIPRRISKDLLLLPFRLVRAVIATRRMIAGADVIVGFGGYLAGTAYLAAKISRIPIVVHEANARAGMANRLGSFFTDEIALVDANAGLRQGIVIGLPMREKILSWAMRVRSDSAESKAAARRILGLDPNKPTVVVIGGSQGSLRINTAMAQALESLLAHGAQVLHAVGTRNQLPAAKPGYFPTAYLSEIELAYAAADVLVARSGAATCQEVLAFGLPAVFVPLPFGNGEQALNAEPLVDAGAAVIIKDDQINGEKLATGVLEILQDEKVRDKMRNASQHLARLDAAEELAAMVVRVANRRK
jgi:UDP-N-acetylglucosamine--N-acetylmuramyl-(pentapeptide) pyrophosphoryl-undecaprenol N-acetylglucosamine transferase